MPAARPSDPEYRERLRAAATYLGFSEKDTQDAIRGMSSEDRFALTEVVDWIRDYEFHDALYNGVRDTPF